MKIVINKCYGGFGLSQQAMELYAKKKNKKLYSYVEDRSYQDKDVLTRKYIRGIEGFIVYHFTEDKGDFFIWNKQFNDSGYLVDYDLDRADPDLIAVVEELKKLADGSHANLKIVEIPDNIEYEIEEYDGQEWIAESHRTWG